MAETQNFQNHVRYFPLVHFIIMPFLIFNFIWQAVRLYQEPSWDKAEFTILSIFFFLIILASRLQALTVQNRVIKLEESLRYRELLTPEMVNAACNLKTGQIFALRFAPDEELSELVQKTLAGEFSQPKDIKLAVKNWRGDYLRT